MQNAKQVLALGLTNMFIIEERGHLLIGRFGGEKRVDMYAAGPAMVLTTHSEGALLIDVESELDQADEMRWECGGLIVRVVSSATVEVSNAFEPGCSAQIKMVGEAIQIKTESTVRLSSDGSRTKVYFVKYTNANATDRPPRHYVGAAILFLVEFQYIGEYNS